MKRWIKNIVLSLCSVALMATSAALVSCGSNENVDDASSSPTTSTTQTVYKVDVSMTEFTMNVHEEILLTAVATKDGQATDGEVVWTSSNPSVATVDNGKVVALQTGSATITATANGVSGTCVITVVNTAGVPQIVVDANDMVQILVGATFQIQPTLIYNGNTYTDATYAYTSADTAVFTVDENGLITAVSEGESDLTVSATWRNFSGTEVTEVIRVKVIEDIAIELFNVETTKIYTSNKDFGNGESYSNTVSYGANIYYNGNLIDSTGATWASSNPNVATIDETTGVVTAVSVGETTITLSYLSASGKTYVSEEILVTVALPAVEKNMQLLMGAQDNVNPLQANAIFGDDENQTIVEITELTEDGSQTISYTDGKITASLEEGEKQWLISNGEYGYIVNVLVVTNVIRQAEDLRIFDYTDKNNIFDGTYVLANNIDASEYTHYVNVGWSTAFSGLTGTFDGRGYTIDGITLTQGGLFGVIYGGSVKNVAFTNVTLSTLGNAKADNIYTLATRARKNAKISDVFVSIKAWQTNAGTTTAALMSQTDEGVSFSNVMVVTPKSDLEKGRAVLATVGGISTFVNTYVLSSVQGFNAQDTMDGVVKYATLVDFSTNVNVSELGFNEIWDLTGEYPVFKTSKKPTPYSLSIDKTSKSIYTEETTTLTATATDFLGNAIPSSLIHWTSSAPAIATVVGGVVNGVGEGVATITASFATLTVSCQVTITQKQENVNISVGKTNANKLYTATLELNENTYSKTATYIADATLNGASITDGFMWASDNEEVLIIDKNTGVATAVAVGTANITVSYRGASGMVYTSDAFTVTVEMPTIETGKEIVFGRTDAKNPVVVSQFTDNAEFAPTTIMTANNEAIAYDVANNNVMATLTEGKYEWIISNGEYGYKVNVWVATNAIRTAEDLKLFSVPDATVYLEGTYVLANNIDATNYVHCMNVGWSSKANGLTGTFDGRGYTIDGITIRQGGLFGVISSGKVQNVAFTNVKLSAMDDTDTAKGNHLYVLATLVWYNVKIDNVFVEIDEWIGSASKTTAVLFHSVKKATPSITNVMIITPAATGSETTVAPVVCNAANATFTNVYVISPITSTAITGVTQYSDVVTFKANVSASTLTGFNEYWDLSGAYPIFKSAN